MEKTTTRNEPFFSGLIDDQPTNEDLLDFEAYAQAFAQMILHKDTKTPLTLGIYGNWGTGKTSLMKMIEGRLKTEGILTIWFNAWQYSREDELWAAFLQSVLNQVKDDLSCIQRIRFSFRLLWHRLDAQKIPGLLLAYLLRTIAVMIPFLIALPISQQIGQQVYQMATQFAGGIVSVALGWWVLIKPLWESIQQNVTINFDAFLKSSDYKNHIAFLDNFREHFEDIVYSLPEAKNIKQRRGKRNEELNNLKKLVVFIDDLDRCSPDSILQVLDAMKIFVNVPGCLYVLGLDLQVVQKAITEKYPNNQMVQRQYLRKIIELSFQLPPLTIQQMSNFTKKIPVTLPDERCQAVFVEGLIANPREIKRTINLFSLLWFLSNTRQELSKSITPVRLAKIVVIQQSYPDFYELLVSNPLLLKKAETYAIFFEHKDKNAQLDERIASYLENKRLRKLLSLYCGDNATCFSDLDEDEIAVYFTLTRQIKMDSEEKETDESGEIAFLLSKSSKRRECPYCGEEVPENANFCIKCGNALSGDDRTTTLADIWLSIASKESELHDETGKICPNCHAFMPIGTKFCTNCGYKFFE